MTSQGLPGAQYPPGTGQGPLGDPQALLALGTGLAIANTTAGLIGRGAYWLDDKLYGKRGALVAGLALVTWVASLFSAWAYAALLIVFAAFVYLLVLARVWGLRDGGVAH